jgi:sialic acid synthase SpsE
MTPCIVAELSCNHLGSLPRALDLIWAAKGVGADAVKLQCWHPDLMVLNRQYVISEGTWAGRNLYDLYQEAWTPWEWFPILFDHARMFGIECFASVFDHEALSFLENLGCPRYKIASFEALDVGLVRSTASTGKPIIISTGACSKRDLDALLGNSWLEPRNLTLLYCVSEYPAKPASFNLRSLDPLRSKAAHVGVSDHTLGLTIPIAATALGATMIEKHLTLDRSKPTLDATFSVEPNELREMVQACRDTAAALGEPGYRNDKAGKAAALGRSFWVRKPIPEGTLLTAEVIAHAICTARPNLGLPCDTRLEWAKATRDLIPNTPLMPDDIRHAR